MHSSPSTTFWNTSLAKTAISMEFGRDLETIKVDGYENEEILLSYIRQDDGKPFKYKVKFDKENIRMIWAGREIDEFGDGRWRDKPEDSIISYSVVDDGVEVRQLHSDGSKAKRIIENFF